jgi:hypothetical protein
VDATPRPYNNASRAPLTGPALLRHLREQRRDMDSQIDTCIFRREALDAAILALETGKPIPATPDERKRIHEVKR